MVWNRFRIFSLRRPHLIKMFSIVKIHNTKQLAYVKIYFFAHATSFLQQNPCHKIPLRRLSLTEICDHLLQFCNVPKRTPLPGKNMPFFGKTFLIIGRNLIIDQLSEDHICFLDPKKKPCILQVFF